MVQKLLPLAMVLTILATDAIAGLNLDQPNCADAQAQLNQAVSAQAQETEVFRITSIPAAFAASLVTASSKSVTEPCNAARITLNLNFTINSLVSISPEAREIRSWNCTGKPIQTSNICKN